MAYNANRVFPGYRPTPTAVAAPVVAKRSRLRGILPDALMVLMSFTAVGILFFYSYSL